MMRRRSLIAAFAAASAGLIGLARMGRRKGRVGVPPPGASSDFAARCIRCSRCAEACPVRAIRVGSSVTLTGAELPTVVANATACILCMKCTEVCPTDALRPIPRALDAIREHVRMGVAQLDRTVCITHTRQGSCRLCFEVCPFSGEAIILSGLGQGPAILAEACVGCGLCAEACPERAKAITILPRRRGLA